MGATSLALANECCSPVGPSRGASDNAVPPGGEMRHSSGEASGAPRWHRGGSERVPRTRESLLFYLLQ